MIDRTRIVVTGGGGKLAKELGRQAPGIRLILHEELDVTDAIGVRKMFQSLRPAVVIHAAAFTDLLWVERNPDAAQAMVEGARVVAIEAEMIGAKMVLPSSDYVFSGERPGGMYREEDIPAPVNRYGALKADQETVVSRVCRDILITRGTMKDPGWRHPRAPIDMWESIMLRTEYAAALLRLIDLGAVGVFHIGGPRVNVFEYAKLHRPDVQPSKLADFPLRLPKDCSLDTTKFQKFIEERRSL